MRIGEVAERSGVSPRMLRHYERVGLITPAGRTASGYRDYAEADLVRLTQIEGLRALGMSLAQVADALAGVAATPETLIAVLTEQTRERIERDTALLSRLTALAAVPPGDWEAALAAAQQQSLVLPVNLACQMDNQRQNNLLKFLKWLAFQIRHAAFFQPLHRVQYHVTGSAAYAMKLHQYQALFVIAKDRQPTQVNKWVVV